MNVFCISGNLGDAPEIREVGDSVVTEFRIAHNEKFKRNGREEEITSWFTVERWGEAFADFAEKFLDKGSKVYVTGSVRIEEWEKDGQVQRKVKIRANAVDLETWPEDDGGSSSRGRSNSNRGGGRSNSNRGGGGGGGSSSRGRGRKDSGGSYDPAFDNDDIPF